MSRPHRNRERSTANTAVAASRLSHAATGSSCPDLICFMGVTERDENSPERTAVVPRTRRQ